jgi:hypothetical protein
MPELVNGAGKRVLGEVPGDEIIEMAVMQLPGQFEARSPARGSNLADRLRVRQSELDTIRQLCGPVLASGGDAGERLVALQTEQKRILETDPAWKDVLDAAVALGVERHDLEHRIDPLAKRDQKLGPVIIALDVLRANLGEVLEVGRSSHEQVAAFAALASAVRFIEGLAAVVRSAEAESMLPSPIPEAPALPESPESATRAKMLADASRVLQSMHAYALQLKIAQGAYKPKLDALVARHAEVQTALEAILG